MTPGSIVAHTIHQSLPESMRKVDILAPDGSEDPALIQKMLRGSGVPVSEHRMPASYMPDNFLTRRLYSDEMRKNLPPEVRGAQIGHVHFPEHVERIAPEVVAHELGHALNDKHLLGKIVHSPFSGIGLRAAPLTGFGIGFTDEETISTPKAMALAAAPALPTLAAEAGASIRADRLMRQHGVSPAALSRGRKNLLRAFGTYTLAPAAAALNVPIMRKVRSALKGKPKSQEPASPAPEKTAYDLGMHHALSRLGM